MHSLLFLLQVYYLMTSPAVAAIQEPPAGNQKPEIVSLLGKPLYSLPDEKETLPPVQKELEADPSNPELMPADANPLQLATYGYGIANWRLYNGRTAKAREQFEKIVTSPHWPAFGFIAAEVELARSKSQLRQD